MMGFSHHRINPLRHNESPLPLQILFLPHSRRIGAALSPVNTQVASTARLIERPGHVSPPALRVARGAGPPKSRHRAALRGSLFFFGVSTIVTRSVPVIH